MVVNVKALLDRPVESAKKPSTKPPGAYSGVIASFKFDESSRKKTPFVRLTVKNCQPLVNGKDGTPAIPPEALLEEDGTPMDLTKWSPYEDYYLTEDALYRVRELMESCGINIKGRSFSVTIPELVNQVVNFNVVHETITVNEQSGETRIVAKIGSMQGA